MDIFTQFFQSSPFALPLFIFTARVMDVSLGTLRIISLSRGRKYLAPILGFFEVFIWVVAISQLVRNLTDISGYLAYAAGFAVGNYLGMWLEEKLALGMLTLRIFAVREGDELSKRLAGAGFGVTVLEGHGAEAEVKVLFVIIQRLAHRGPDEQRVTSTPLGTLGHARLSILDVAESHQPMSDGPRWIVFNGEVYNDIPVGVSLSGGRLAASAYL
jgi:uncharacterized protein YebE (UPF0316 family)